MREPFNPAEVRCACFDMRPDESGQIVRFHHARLTHDGPWPGYGACYVTATQGTRCRCVKFTAEEKE